MTGFEVVGVLAFAVFAGISVTLSRYAGKLIDQTNQQHSAPTESSNQ